MSCPAGHTSLTSQSSEYITSSSNGPPASLCRLLCKKNSCQTPLRLCQSGAWISGHGAVKGTLLGGGSRFISSGSGHSYNNCVARVPPIFCAYSSDATLYPHSSSIRDDDMRYFNALTFPSCPSGYTIFYLYTGQPQEQYFCSAN